jgi:hypothetical protein
MLSAINQKHGGFDIVFLAKFAQEYLSRCGRYHRKQPQVEQSVCVVIGGGVQPELLIVDSNYGFVSRNVIRVSTFCGL